MKRRARPTRRAEYRRYEAVATPAARPARALVAPRRHLRQAAAGELDRPRLASTALVAMLLVAAVWIGFGDPFYVAQLKVIGQSRVPPEEIASGSGLAGMHILWVNSSAAEATLLQTTPSIRAASVACSLPADCTIRVAEREPLWAWRWGQALLWVDADGVVFPARSHLPDLLTVESTDAQPPAPGRRVDDKLRAAVASAALAMPDVRTFRYSAARGLAFTDPNGYPVYLGLGSNMADRAAVWRALRENLAARGITPKYVDVRYPLAPYYER